MALVGIGVAGLISGLIRLGPARLALPGVVVRRRLHVSFAVSFFATGELPAIVIATDHPTHVVGALDLLLVVVPSLVSAVWLWRGPAIDR